MVEVIKKTWKGIFCYRNEMKVEYAYAYTQKQARFIMMRRLAKKQGVIPSVVFGYFKDHENSCEIKLEIDWKEDVDEQGGDRLEA
jgi:hypothetical protein